MNQKILKIGAAVPLMTVGVLMGANSANAATITGPGTIDFSGAVNISIVDNPPLGLPLNIEDDTVLNFLPVADSTGEIATLFPEEATGGFVEFGIGVSPASPNVSIIFDTVVEGGELNPVSPFLLLSDPSGSGPTADDVFNLEDFGAVSFDETIVIDPITGNPTTNTTVSVPVTGEFISDTGETFDGFGVFSTQFEGLNETQTQQALLDGVENQSFSASFSAVPKDIPEPTSIVSLGAILIGGALSLRKKQMKESVSKTI